MRLLLIRHAEPDYSIDSITPKGRMEAELLSRRMIQYDIRDFYVSPLGRARDTAAYTLEKMNREATVLPWLKEFNGRYPDPETGKLRLAWDIKPRIWPDFPGVWNIDSFLENTLFDEGNFREVWQETVDGVTDLMGSYGYRKDGPVWLCDHNTQDTIALFCHFGVECVLLGHMLNLPAFVLWHGTVAAPSSVTTVYTEERRDGIASFRMQSFGDISHLYVEDMEPSFAARFCETWDSPTERKD